MFLHESVFVCEALPADAPEGASRRVHSVGTISRGWRLLIVKRSHSCSACGLTIRAGKAAWFKLGAYLCHHGHENRTGAKA